ncbi:MAG: hypothetical protein WCC60_17300, partial [Ilumatobacteraceae bacterium]
IVLGGSDDKKVSPTLTTVSVATTATLATDDTTEPTITAPIDTEPDSTEPVETFTIDTLPDENKEIAGSPAGKKGSRDAPVPAGTVADIGGGWRLQVLGYTADATADVMAASEFNDPPPAGSTFSIVKVALGYFGINDPKSGYEPTISALGASSVELSAGCGTIANDLNTYRDIFSGGVIQGSLCFVTTPADAASLQMYAIGDYFGDNPEVFIEAAEPASATPLAAMKGPQDGAAFTPARLKANPVGTVGDVGEGWSVSVTGAAHDITDAVVADSFNEPPPEGYRFIAVDVAYTFNGTGSDSAFSVTTHAVADGNVALAEECGSIPTPIDDFVDVFAGGSVAGSVCFVVPADATGLVLYSSTGFDTEAVTFATS